MVTLSLYESPPPPPVPTPARSLELLRRSALKETRHGLGAPRVGHPRIDPAIARPATHIPCAHGGPGAPSPSRIPPPHLTHGPRESEVAGEEAGGSPLHQPPPIRPQGGAPPNPSPPLREPLVTLEGEHKRCETPSREPSAFSTGKWRP